MGHISHHISASIALTLVMALSSACDTGDEPFDEYGDEMSTSDSGDDEFRSFLWESFPAIEDAVVKKNHANTNYSGGLLGMRTNSNANKMSYLKFDLSSYADDIGEVKLKLCGRSDNLQPLPAIYRFRVMTVQDNWSENQITWNNKPADVAEASNAGVMPRFNECEWVTLDLDDVHSALSNDNILSLKLGRGPTITNPTALFLADRQYVDASMRPELRVWPAP